MHQLVLFHWPTGYGRVHECDAGEIPLLMAVLGAIAYEVITEWPCDCGKATPDVSAIFGAEIKG